MDHAEHIISVIRHHLPEAQFEVERSEDKRGPVWIDVRQEDQAVCVEWRQGMSLGLTSLPSDGYGEAADEIYDTATALAQRVLDLFTRKQRTQSPREALICELRGRRRLSQEDLARLMDVSQPYVSKAERQRDMSIQSLKALIRAMGGELEIVARFGDQRVKLNQFDDVTSSTESA